MRMYCKCCICMCSQEHIDACILHVLYLHVPSGVYGCMHTTIAASACTIRVKWMHKYCVSCVCIRSQECMDACILHLLHLFLLSEV